MSYSSFDFPHTHMYDSDLRELLAMYKKLTSEYDRLVEELNELEAWKREHQGEYEELVKKVAGVQADIAKVQAEVEAQYAYIDTKCQQCKDEVDTKFAMALNHFTNEFNTLAGNVLAKLEQMQIQLNNFNSYLIDALASNKAEIYQHVDDMFTYWVDHLPDYEHLIVYNPARGEMTTVQEAINDLYASFNVFGLTAIQYDSLSLTAQEYDDYELTAREYDTWGYVALGYPDPRYYMMDPFTGELTLVKNVVDKLAAFHKEGLTAEDYDALLLTAEEYDNKLITAFNYDWFGKDILVA